MVTLQDRTVARYSRSCTSTSSCSVRYTTVSWLWQQQLERLQALQERPLAPATAATALQCRAAVLAATERSLAPAEAA